jgi:hypothetical protein
MTLFWKVLFHASLLCLRSYCLERRDRISQSQQNTKPVSASPNPHSRIILAIIVLGTLMGSLDSTIVLLAFPTINDSLHSDIAFSIWMILAYLLVIAVATTQMGRIGDIYGRCRIFNLGFIVFHSWLCTLWLRIQHLFAHCV